MISDRRLQNRVKFVLQEQKKSRKGYPRDAHILEMAPAANGSEFVPLRRAISESADRKKRHCPAHDTRE